jgi:putative spermidine/putrescine transport system permease protein
MRRLPFDRAALLCLPAAAFTAAFLLYPLLSLIGTSFGGSGGAFTQYTRLVSTPVYALVLQRTVLTAVVTAAACALLAYPIAWHMAHAGARGRAILLAVVLLPFWTNLLVRSYGWMILLNPKGVLNTLLLDAGLIQAPLSLVYNQTGVLIGMVQIMLPYMILPLSSVMSRIDPAAVRAARSLGGGPASAFFRVYLPQTLPGLMAGILLVFTISLGFFVIPAILGGPRDLMLAQLIEFNINTALNWPFAAAISTALLVTTLLLYAIGQRWLGLGAIWGDAR